MEKREGGCPYWQLAVDANRRGSLRVSVHATSISKDRFVEYDDDRRRVRRSVLVSFLHSFDYRQYQCQHHKKVRVFGEEKKEVVEVETNEHELVSVTDDGFVGGKEGASEEKPNSCVGAQIRHILHPLQDWNEGYRVPNVSLHGQSA